MFQSFRPAPPSRVRKLGRLRKIPGISNRLSWLGDESNGNILLSGEPLVLREGPALSDLLTVARGCEAQAGRRCDTSRTGVRSNPESLSPASRGANNHISRPP